MQFFLKSIMKVSIHDSTRAATVASLIQSLIFYSPRQCLTQLEARNTVRYFNPQNLAKYPLSVSEELTISSLANEE